MSYLAIESDLATLKSSNAGLLSTLRDFIALAASTTGATAAGVSMAVESYSVLSSASPAAGSGSGGVSTTLVAAVAGAVGGAAVLAAGVAALVTLRRRNARPLRPLEMLPAKLSLKVTKAVPAYEFMFYDAMLLAAGYVHGFRRQGWQPQGCACA